MIQDIKDINIFSIKQIQGMHNLDQFFKIPTIPNPPMPPPLLPALSTFHNTPTLTYLTAYRRQHQQVHNCFNNLNYPACDKNNHEYQPLAMVCIDQLCENKGLLCAFCENQEHYGHVCVSLKIYLDAVFGHLYEGKPESQELLVSGKIEEVVNQPVKMQEMHVHNSKGKHKSKNKLKKNKPYFSSTTNSNISFNTSFKKPQSKSNLYFITKIQQQKNYLLTQISRQKQSIIQKFHDLQTNIIKYYNKIVQQATNLITIQNPLQQIQKILNNIQALDDENQLKGQQNQDEKQSKNNKAGDNNSDSNRRNNKKQQYQKLRNFISSIIKQTRIYSKYNLSQKLQLILKNVTKNMNLIQSNLTKFQTTFQQIINKSNEPLLKQLTIVIPSSYSSFLQPKQFLFSEKLKGYKFTISNGNRTATQMGMESSGQRFAFLQPSIPKPNPFDSTQCYTWGIKINKIIGWVGIGISLKRKVSQAKFFFNYTQTYHGSYLISANGYTWSHSSTEYNSAYKSFTFTAGDIIYIQYNIKQKKLKFYKNQNQNKIELDVIDPPADDEYCPCVNMCSTGEEVQVVNQKPSFLNV